MKNKICSSIAVITFALFGTTALAECETYTVQPGDTLGDIAAQFLGSSRRFPEIVAANAAKFPQGPDLIEVGVAVTIPCDNPKSDAAQDIVTDEKEVIDAFIAGQRAALKAVGEANGAGPQSPRDLTTSTGNNPVTFATAPAATQMNLCNIHFHENAEHRGGQFTTFAGNGNGLGYRTGYVYDGELTPAELTPVSGTIGANDYDSLEPGDTIEIHFVHTSADVVPGPTLGSCLSEAIGNPQLRVETVVAVLVNDTTAADFTQMADVQQVNGYYQAPNVPDNLGPTYKYAGSTTGPSYNETTSPFQVSWSVRPLVVKVDINSVDAWLQDNRFDEKYAHAVRNLVLNPNLTSPVSQ